MIKEKRGNRGSAAVEAAVALPLFLFLMLFFFHTFHVYVVRETVYEAGIEAAEYAAEYYFLQNRLEDAVELSDSDSVIKKGVDQAGCVATAAAHFRESLDEPELIEKYVEGGVNGISILGPVVPRSDGDLEFRISYTICIRTPFLPTVTKKVVETIRQKPYTGDPGQADGNEESDPYVYVTDNQEVYHRSRGCTHLVLGMHTETLAAAKKEGYHACAYCGNRAGILVLVGPEGECYHSTGDCSGLKRTVRRVRLSEVGGLPPCSRCGK